ncbi:MAG: DUF1566 domain-containing protein [SAR324 cluster bacterium]|nr:DUF1566 domain-containing protein [SAR324 cluster bacterium]
MKKKILFLWMGLLTAGNSGWAAPFTDNGNSTVTDSATGLVWQQTDGGQKTWENALTYCEGLSLGGATDWRLPNRNELQSLVDYSKSNPAIDTTAFPNTNSSYYWSSSAYASNTSYAWGVNFNRGYVFSDNKTVSDYVRCVRGGQ